MKKALAIVMFAALLFSMVSCAMKTDEDDNISSQTTETVDNDEEVAAYETKEDAEIPVNEKVTEPEPAKEEEFVKQKIFKLPTKATTYYDFDGEEQTVTLSFNNKGDIIEASNLSGKAETKYWDETGEKKKLSGQDADTTT